MPSDKVPVEDGKTKFILVRTGEERQGVVGLFQPGLVGEQAPGLSVRFTGINRSAIASYLVTLYYVAGCAHRRRARRARRRRGGQVP